MVRRTKNFTSRFFAAQAGQALVLVLAFVMLGSLIILPTLALMTTTLKTMQIMVEKGFLTRSDTRPHLYSPATPAEETQAGLLKDLAHKAFDGSVRNLLVRAVQDAGLSQDELQEVRRLIDVARRSGKGGGK